MKEETRSNIDLELRTLLLLTRNLPKIKGIGRIANLLKSFYLRKERLPVVMDVLDFYMELFPGESISNNSCLFFPQLYDWKEISFIKKNLNKGDVFVDVGAHIGFYSLVASRQVGDSGRVISIEADPEMCKRLNRNIELNKISNIEVLNFGVSNKEEVLRLQISDGNKGGNSFLKDRKGLKEVEVKCFSLLELLKKNNINEVRGLKIDVEGYEYMVLRHFFSDKNNSYLFPKFIIVENNKNIYGNSLEQLLVGMGYEMKYIRANNYVFFR